MDSRQNFIALKMSLRQLITQVIAIPDLAQLILDYIEEVLVMLTNAMVYYYDEGSNVWIHQLHSHSITCDSHISIRYNDMWIDGITGLPEPDEFPRKYKLEYCNAHSVILGGMYYQVGGWCWSGDDHLRETQELWRYMNNRWEQLPSFHYHRENYAVVGVNTRIYVIGGTVSQQPQQPQPTTDIMYVPFIEYYDIVLGRWDVITTTYCGVNCVLNVHDTIIWICSDTAVSALDTSTHVIVTYNIDPVNFISTGSTLYVHSGNTLIEVKTGRHLSDLPIDSDVHTMSAYLLRQCLMSTYTV